MKNGRNYAAQGDPARNFHFSRQWSEPLPCEGFKTIGEAAAEVISDLKFRRQVEHLHRLGPRAVGELLAEIGVERSIRTVVDRKLQRYSELEPETLQAAGGDGFWPVPLREVEP